MDLFSHLVKPKLVVILVLRFFGWLKLHEEKVSLKVQNLVQICGNLLYHGWWFVYGAAFWGVKIDTCFHGLFDNFPLNAFLDVLTQDLAIIRIAWGVVEHNQKLRKGLDGLIWRVELK